MSLKIDILYEDNHLIVINKPAGYLVHGDETGDKPLTQYVEDYIRRKYNKPGNVFVGVVHRLDRPVSGCLIFTRTSKALSRMNEQLRRKKIEKNYWAITRNAPNQLEGRLIHFLVKDHQKNIVKAFPYKRPGTDVKKAVLDFRMIAHIDNLHLMEIKPLTGRPHQIRAQLSAEKCPILSDVKYGSVKNPSRSSIYLHARSVSFSHPVRKTHMTVYAPLPRDPVWSKFAHFEDMEQK